LRARIRSAVADQIRDADQVLVIVQGVLGLGGAFVATAAQAIPESLQEPFGWLPAWEDSLVFWGAVCALSGSLSTVWLQRRAPQILKLASEAQSYADEERNAARDRIDKLRIEKLLQAPL
jgi:hypothetical protein